MISFCQYWWMEDKELGTKRLRLREMAPQARPQERLQRFGAGALSDAELLAMILRSGNKRHDVMSVAHAMLNRFGCLSALMPLNAKELQSISGVGPVKALQLQTVVELARRIMQESSQVQCLDSPEKVYRYMLPVCKGLVVEKFWVLCLNRKNRLIRLVECTSGTADSSLVHPREVFREAIQVGSTAIIGVHNHPSGDPCPSNADRQVTQKLSHAAEVLSIDFLDHLIVGESNVDPKCMGYFSFSESGLI